MAAKVEKSGSGPIIDTADFKVFARHLRAASPVLRAELLVNMRAVGGVVASEAKSLVAGASVTVPDSIKVRISGVNVAVQAGGPGVPMGGLLELGNVGGSGSSFRHPVFGNKDVWVTQPTHPYLAPALQAKTDAVIAGVLDALDRAVVEAIAL